MTHHDTGVAYDVGKGHGVLVRRDDSALNEELVFAFRV
jgi:hypothetical protein